MRRDGQDDGREPQHLQQGRKGTKVVIRIPCAWKVVLHDGEKALHPCAAAGAGFIAVCVLTDRAGKHGQDNKPVNMTVPAAGTWSMRKRLTDDITAVSDAADGLTEGEGQFHRDTMLMPARSSQVSVIKNQAGQSA